MMITVIMNMIMMMFLMGGDDDYDIWLQRQRHWAF